MTNLADEWPHALDSVRLTIAARWRAQTWDVTLQSQVLDAAAGIGLVGKASEAWLTLVATFASPDEHPAKAAQRLTRYLLAHQETYGRMPSLGAVQKHAADRHLKEPR